MYRPRPRSRSPDRTQRAYSPSRPLSPPPSRYDRYPPRRHDDYPPYPAPDSRRYGGYPPETSDYPKNQSIGYEEPYYRRRHEEPYPGNEYMDEPGYAPPLREQNEREYDDWGSGGRGYEPRGRNWGRGYDRGMAIDREEFPSRRDVDPAHEQWERGRDPELARYDAPYSTGPASDLGDQSNHGRKGKNPSEPSMDVIFLGLDPELTEDDFLGYLRTEHKAAISGVKIIRDKFTGASKCFGFAQFQSLDGASDFINNNYPTVLMPALYAHSDPRKVKIDFSTPQQNPHSGHGSYQSAPAYVRPGHDGMRDIGSPGGGKRVLLLRGLDSMTTPGEVIRRIGQEIARMVGKQGRESEAESSIVRVVLIADKSARSSWGYGFVELATSELASALLPFLLSPQHQPTGFLIHDVPVAASFSNPSSFVPVSAGPLGGEFIIRPSRFGGFGSETIDKPEGQWCAYWHEKGGAMESIPRGAPGISEDGNIELTPAHRAFLGNLAGVPQSQAASSQGFHSVQATGMTPVSVEGVMQPIKIGISKGKKKEEAAIIPITQKRSLLDDGEEDDKVGKDTVLLSRTKGARIVPPTSSSRKIANNINKWNTKQSELAIPDPVSENAPPKGISDANSAIGSRRPVNAESGSNPAQPSEMPAPSPAVLPSATQAEEFDYTDVSTFATTGKVACLLCQRQFKSEDILRKHVAQSDLHKNNLQDPATCQAGQRRKYAIGSSTSTPEPFTSIYRDRAAERREAFNQPAVPSRAEREALAASTAAYQGKRKPPSAKPKQPSPHEPSKQTEENNVGNQLLAKMGWKTGEGLGLAGEGRAEPIKVQQFESRAGLGASKGVEAGRWSGPGGWQQRAKDMTKERYNSESGQK
ncbi:hypothetical protein C349_07117 [Cryptococcus neoformans var. grubii Br795]|nr:hypothetical protein C350_06977 [Cryptococcus neoformans var. grubii MW-RSA36]OXG71544.1 hypothetical protein C349_07117 [Cryptococcus neoformans var. grubii Br795]OXL04896.1 hypothetical protein C348_06966 [Cryptococcus neoformans var. grubii Gb118]